MNHISWQKVLRDIWSNKGRTALVVLSIAVGVFAFGGLQTAADSCVLVPTDRAEWREHYQPLSESEQTVLGVVARDEFAKQGARMVDIEARLPDYAERTIYRTLGTLKGRGLADQEKARAPYRITEKGRALLHAWGNGHG